ncbi:hypothetical protein PG996_008607 [Apiospora saccharicola]|uniref:Uncharacterized protein n=1 Tax=Apiospora saccharicola TaxID=335842 RepID=A0ABR1UYG9_9PEZI
MAANDFCLPGQRWDLAAFLCFQRRNKSTSAAESRCREVNVRLIGIRYDLGAPADRVVAEAHAIQVSGSLEVSGHDQRLREGRLSASENTIVITRVRQILGSAETEPRVLLVEEGDQGWPRCFRRVGWKKSSDNHDVWICEVETTPSRSFASDPSFYTEKNSSRPHAVVVGAQEDSIPVTSFVWCVDQRA